MVNTSRLKPRQNLSLQTIILTASSGYSAVVTAFLMLFAARWSNPQAFGEVAVSIAAAATFVGFADFGTNQLWVRNLTSGVLEINDFRSRFTWKILVLTLVSGVVLAGSFWFEKIQAQVTVSIAVGYFSFLNLNNQIPIRAMGRMDLVAYLIVIERTLSLVGMLLCIELGITATTALWVAMVFASIVSIILSLTITPKVVRPGIFFGDFRNPWSGSFSFGLTGAALSLNGLELSALSSVLGNYAAGMYGAVSRWVQPLYIIVSSFASSSAPFIANAQDFRAAFKLIKNSLWLPLVSMLGSIILFIVAPQLIELLLGPAYADSILLLRLMLIGSIPAYFNHIATIVLQFLGREKSAALILVPLSVAQLPLVMFLSFLFGEKGAAITYIILQVMQAIFFGIVMFRMHGASEIEK